FVHELLCRDVRQTQVTVARLDLMTSRVHQVCFAKADAAVNVERVIGFSRSFCDGLRSRMCELVAGAYDKSLESVFGIQREFYRFYIYKGRSTRRQAVRLCRFQKSK